MPKSIINGIRVNYRVFGKPEPGVQPVVIIHGACQSLLTWEYQFEFFESHRNFRFIAIDLPGHGDSEGEGFRSISEYTGFLREFIEKEVPERPILAGHSMGGRIVQTFAIDYPVKLSACILVGTAPKIRFRKPAFKALENDFENFCAMATNNSLTDRATEKMKKDFYDRLISTGQRTCINDLTACNKFDVSDEISKINVPTLIICGEKDTLVPLSESMELNEKIKNSEIHTIRHSGHFMMMETPAEFSLLISNFLDSFEFKN